MWSRRRPVLPLILPIVLLGCSVVAACTSSGRDGSRPGASGRPGTATGASGAASDSASGSAPGSVSGSASSPAAPPSGRFTIAFAGDVHFAGRVATRLAHDPATVFAQAAPGLRKADLTMVNLETAITTGGVQQDKEFTFRAPPIALVALKDAGIDVATMANNHGADYGTQGVLDSLRASRDEHFPIIGIGKNATQAFAPFTRTINGVKVAIFAADRVQDETTLRLFSAGPGHPGVANAYDPRLITAVRKAHAAGYTVIVYVHWGIEYTTCPSSDQEQLAGQLADAGASAVIGTHPHVLQGGGWLPNGTYVEYSTGNYLWWMSFGNDQDDNGVFTLTFDHDKVVKDDFAPSHLDDRGVPVPATGATKRRIDAEWNNDRACTDLSAHRP